MMSKEETIGTLENAKHFTYGDEKFNDAFDSAINYLKETSWIPVTERLPHKDGRYFVTTSVWDVSDNGKLHPTPYVALETFKNGKWSFDGDDDDDNEWVTAWLQMEMPEPYKEGE